MKEILEITSPASSSGWLRRSQNGRFQYLKPTRTKEILEITFPASRNPRNNFPCIFEWLVATFLPLMIVVMGAIELDVVEMGCCMSKVHHRPHHHRH
jgi:hypothetical protein